MADDKKIRVSERERKVLEQLFDWGQEHEEGSCTYTRVIATHTKLSFKDARGGVRALVRKGLAEFHRGLFDDDGMVAGSGYCISSAGTKLIAAERDAKEKAEEAAAAQGKLV